MISPSKLFAVALLAAASTLGHPAFACYDGTPGSTIVRQGDPCAAKPATGTKPATGAPIEQCNAEAFHGRHEACCRAVEEADNERMSAVGLGGHWDSREKIIQSCAKLDQIDAHPATPQIGMTPEQVIHDTYLGQPDTVNRTVTAAGAREQWVYGAGQYLYFEGGRLVAMQTRRSAQ
jgi:hypothetical protein